MVLGTYYTLHSNWNDGNEFTNEFSMSKKPHTVVYYWDTGKIQRTVNKFISILLITNLCCNNLLTGQASLESTFQEIAFTMNNNKSKPSAIDKPTLQESMLF